MLLCRLIVIKQRKLYALRLLLCGELLPCTYVSRHAKYKRQMISKQGQVLSSSLTLKPQNFLFSCHKQNTVTKAILTRSPVPPTGY